MSTNDNAEDTTVKELLAMAKSYDAGVVKVIPRSNDGTVMGLVVVCDARSADEILEAIEEIEEAWDEDDNDPDSVAFDEASPDSTSTPVPIRFTAVSDKGEFVMGMTDAISIDASLVFGEHDALELSFNKEQMQQIVKMFNERLAQDI